MNMDSDPMGDAPDADGEHLTSSEPVPSLAPPSTSVLSDAPATDTLEAAESQDSLPKLPADEQDTSSSFQAPQISAQTESLLKRINTNAANAAATGTPGWEAAKEQIMKDMATSDKLSTSTPPRESSAPKQSEGPSAADGQSVFKVEGDAAQKTPGSSGRGRGGGRPRGRGRGGPRGSKRKRGEKDEDDLTEDSEIYSPVVTTTKSGRSVQKPSAFVPPPQSPTSTNKRKRSYRRNPEAAVCKICLRGTSPADNMIVFCDGCNTPYHRYCHHPPIDQAVVDEVDKEWYCKQCEKERVVPVPESEVANFVAAQGASLEQRQRYFASLSPGMLVTLLTKATTLKPDLPVFAPEFHSRSGSNSNPAASMLPPPPQQLQQQQHLQNQQQHHLQNQHQQQSATNGHAHPHATYQQTTTSQYPAMQSMSYPPMQQARPGAVTQYINQQRQPEPYVPEGHPPNYPRPGYGLMRTLPPEQEDLQWLTDDDDRFGVFSHMYQVDPRAANAGMHPGMGQMRGGT